MFAQIGDEYGYIDILCLPGISIFYANVINIIKILTYI